MSFVHVRFFFVMQTPPLIWIFLDRQVSAMIYACRMNQVFLFSRRLGSILGRTHSSSDVHHIRATLATHGRFLFSAGCHHSYTCT